MGSVLVSRGLGGVWWLDVRSRHHINDLRLSDDGLHDADRRADVAAANVDLTYEDFLLAVHADDAFRHLAFPYDWRKPLSVSGRTLAAEVDKAWEASGGRPVHLVAHSMGGLVVRVALMRQPRLWRQVGRVVFIGTPHYGSPAIAGYLKNHLW